jgi:hypothetical protein
MSIVKKFLLLVSIVVGSFPVLSQTASSPFSRYGLGESYGNGLVHNQGMGGLGVSQPQYWFLNNQNPALLVYNSLTIFEAGLVVESRRLRNNTISEKNVGGNLNYLATAFPIKPGKWTTSLGLMPYSNVNYNFVYPGQVINSPNDTLSIEEMGSGGLTQLYWSNGVKILPELAIGLKATYVFGPMDDTYTNRVTNVSPYDIHYNNRTLVKDFSFTAGVSYSKDSLGRRHDKRLSFGGTYAFRTNLGATNTIKIFRTRAASTDTIERYVINQQKGRIRLPAALTVGVSYSKGLKWSIGTQLSYQNWGNFRSVNTDDEGLTKSWGAVIGGEITPDPLSLGSYLKRITYRTGVSYDQYPYLANGNSVKDFGINFGLSLPAGRSSLDFAFKVGKRGNKAENILEENYFKVYFGITFNDQWFIKRKFD